MSVQRANQLIEAGLWLRLSGDAQGALRLFERALQLDPGNTRAREYLEAATRALSGGNVTAFSPPAELAPAHVLGRMTQVSPALDGDWGAWAEGKGGPAEPTPWKTPAPVCLPEEGVNAGGGRVDAMELLAREDTPEPEVFSLPDGDTQEYGLPPEGDTQEFGVPAGESELDLLLRGAEDLLELDDHSGAVDLLFKAQELSPGDPRVEALRQRSERMLMAMLESKLGDLGRVPRVRLQPDDIIWLNLDHRAGFVLAQIDGAVSYEDLFALSGMTRLDTARILAQLLDEGVISAG
jgi:tetratricopeptide (TPR) repeat protein